MKHYVTLKYVLCCITRFSWRHGRLVDLRRRGPRCVGVSRLTCDVRPLCRPEADVDAVCETLSAREEGRTEYIVMSTPYMHS